MNRLAPFIIALAFVGCAPKAHAPLAAVTQRVDAADNELRIAEPIARGEVKYRVSAARGHLKEAKPQIVIAEKDFERVNAELKDIKSKWGVRAVLAAYRLWHFLVWAVPVTFIAAFALKYLSGAGIGGSFVRVASTAVWALLTGGISLVKSLAGKLGARASGKSST